MSLRDAVEVGLPGIAIGLFCGLFAGVITLLGPLTAGYAVANGLGLGIPLALAGLGYCVLLARGVFKVGTVAPMAAYWAAAFPLARLLHEATLAVVFGYDEMLSEPLWSFLLFQAMLSIGFTIGFLWLHERIAPRFLLWARVHNPLAGDLAERYLAHAAIQVRRKEAREAQDRDAARRARERRAAKKPSVR
ncbi:hypothetical protein [Allonocardiopsis opalescens]|uniref:hypothetical protein n=1 Tax=Allonocardiopsis opalescens TaxID=1144618 RepID=UPI001B80D335|nr:hypothetical protein [Allonocardiopsis opalescens]